MDYLCGLDKRREEIRELINGQEKLTEEIGAALDKAQTLSELTENAAENAMKVFATNLKQLLMYPPVRV